jgi:hypothetical protein
MFRSFLFWLFAGIAGALRGIENAVKHIQAQIQEREHQLVYKEFEAAINAWEKRTGRKVEREFRQLEEGEEGYNGSDWRNFAMFLGSREAAGWRTNYGISFEEAAKEWREFNVTEPEMWIDGEERDEESAD